ncbi:MAG: phosphoribosyltransferase [Bacteroidetes bacterium]|nr:phosphoribosyltransferase [Bacteroidota bacterium]MBS1629735.1 phosphoribosyltransferase [Bacteroidota bacterium]
MNETTARVPILSDALIRRKLRRMAWQIWEHNSERASITLIGISDNGSFVAEKLAEHLNAIAPIQVRLLRLDINPAAPIPNGIRLSGTIEDPSLVLVDDVANTGRTLLYALRPLMEAQPEKILIAVLVERKHKSFPVAPDIIGQSVATTLQEHIHVSRKDGLIEAYLE